jgi:hypothetical protein
MSRGFEPRQNACNRFLKWACSSCYEDSKVDEQYPHKRKTRKIKSKEKRGETSHIFRADAYPTRNYVNPLSQIMLRIA